MQYGLVAYVLFQLTLTLTVLGVTLCGLVDAFQVSVLAGVFFLFITPLSFLNGLMLFMNYHLAHQISVLLHFI
jgi:hypothetical protein